ncbi:MAG: molybdopterin-synthase adenylyltransferase MoeB [Candidatus Competibacteraceae bacterium]|nr:molybdopterin-synthase adenylyltransferase MoeB [Candidatus Competibacteraceae bacterium]
MEDEELLRYSRQIMLPEVDIEGQQRLGRARVLIVGLGGLGSPVAMYLAAAGVGELVLNDFDRVELSNLQRQIVHNTHDLQRPKVESARERLLALNPLVRVITLDRALEGEALLEQVQAATVVVDASDNLPTRFALNQACVTARRPLVSGAAIRMEGKVMVWRPDVPGAPCYRCLYRSEQAPDEACTSGGVLAPLLGIIGSLQAVEVIKLIIGIGQTLTGRLLLLDARSLDIHTITLPRNPHCPVCGDSAHPFKDGLNSVRE